MCPAASPRLHLGKDVPSEDSSPENPAWDGRYLPRCLVVRGWFGGSSVGPSWLWVSRGGQAPPAPWLYLGQGEGHCPCVPQSSPSPPAPCCPGSTAHPQRGKSKGRWVGATFFIATPSLLMPCNQSVHKWLIMALIAFLLLRPPTGRCICTDLPLLKPTRVLQDSERVTSAWVSFPRCPALRWHPARHQEGRWAPRLLSDLYVGAKDWFGLFVSDGARWYILYFNFN